MSINLSVISVYLFISIAGAHRHKQTNIQTNKQTHRFISYVDRIIRLIDFPNQSVSTHMIHFTETLNLSRSTHTHTASLSLSPNSPSLLYLGLPLLLLLFKLSLSTSLSPPLSLSLQFSFSFSCTVLMWSLQQPSCNMDVINIGR